MQKKESVGRCVARLGLEAFPAKAPRNSAYER
jgi:hypothetical protein